MASWRQKKWIKMVLSSAIVLAMVFSLVNVMIHPALSEHGGYFLLSQDPGDPPPKPPIGQTTYRGPLGPSCDKSDISNGELVALAPSDSPGLTTSAHPILLFYIPYATDNLEGEFSVSEWPGETNEISRVSFTVPNIPGIVSVQLAEKPGKFFVESTRTKQTYYHWFFELHCQNQGISNSKSNLTVHGFIQRIAKTSNVPSWFDEVAQIANRLQGSPQNTQTQQRWKELLRSINKIDLTDKPIIGSVQSPKQVE